MTPCQCLMSSPHPGDDSVDFCGSVTSGRDDPMCEACRLQGHDRDPRQVPFGDPRRDRFSHLRIGAGR